MRRRGPRGRVAPAAWLRGLLWLPTLLALATCAVPEPKPPEHRPKKVLSPEELRAEVHRRVPELAVEEVVVLFEIEPEVVDRVRPAIENAGTPEDQVRAVVYAITDPDGLGLVYDRGSLGSARESLERGRGNCLSLAAVLVGVSRGLGWRARFTEMSLRDDEIIYEADVGISEEHMGAKLSTGGTTFYIDYSGRMSMQSRVRTVSDLRATAQYYSNHAYELVHESHLNGEPVPWEEVRRRFEIATRIEPDFAQAWNNLGVARNRLGDMAGAEAAYERAIALGDRSESAARNLRRLQGLPPEPADPPRPGVPAGWEPVWSD
jgi:transglutaminase-like putative cysteine protease